MDSTKLKQGMDVFDIDGEYVGTIAQRGIGRSLLRYGNFTKQWLILEDDRIQTVLGDKVHLGVTRRHLVEAHSLPPHRSPIELETGEEYPEYPYGSDAPRTR